MFLMVGVSSGRKDIVFNQTVICRLCGQYGAYRVYMTFTQLLLFFIPFIKWNKRYYVELTCCGAVYELDPAVGKRIAAGRETYISEESLRLVSRGRFGGYDNSYGGYNGGYGSNYGNGNYGNGPYTRMKVCGNCGYRTEEDFEFCPKCGRRF